MVAHLDLQPLELARIPGDEIEHLRHLTELLHRDDLHVAIDERAFHGIESIPDAVEYLHSGQSQGKVVVRFNEA